MRNFLKSVSRRLKVVADHLAGRHVNLMQKYGVCKRGNRQVGEYVVIGIFFDRSSRKICRILGSCAFT